jgi:hypothetical protein
MGAKILDIYNVHISSTADPNTTSCFKPTSLCLSEGNTNELGTQSLQVLYIIILIIVCTSGNRWLV